MHIAKQTKSSEALYTSRPETRHRSAVSATDPPNYKQGIHGTAALQESRHCSFFFQLLSKGSKNAKLIFHLYCHQADVKFLSQLFAYHLITVKFLFFFKKMVGVSL